MENGKLKMENGEKWLFDLFPPVRPFGLEYTRYLDESQGRGNPDPVAEGAKEC